MKSLKTVLELDFYGNLLTPRMRDICELYLFDDLSLAEIAEQKEISRQAVHDTVKRASAILDGYEEKLGLVERFKAEKSSVDEAIKLMDVGNYQEAKAKLIDIRNDIITE